MTRNQCSARRISDSKEDKPDPEILKLEKLPILANLSREERQKIWLEINAITDQKKDPWGAEAAETIETHFKISHQEFLAWWWDLTRGSLPKETRADQEILPSFTRKKGKLYINPNDFPVISNENKMIQVTCPTCKKTLYTEIPEKLIVEAGRYPVSCLVLHESHFILVYIDANFKARGAESIQNALTGQMIFYGLS